MVDAHSDDSNGEQRGGNTTTLNGIGSRKLKEHPPNKQNQATRRVQYRERKTTMIKRYEDQRKNISRRRRERLHGTTRIKDDVSIEPHEGVLDDMEDSVSSE